MLSLFILLLKTVPALAVGSSWKLGSLSLEHAFRLSGTVRCSRFISCFPDFGLASTTSPRSFGSLLGHSSYKNLYISCLVEGAITVYF